MTDEKEQAVTHYGIAALSDEDREYLVAMERPRAESERVRRLMAIIESLDWQCKAIGRRLINSTPDPKLPSSQPMLSVEDASFLERHRDSPNGVVVQAVKLIERFRHGYAMQLERANEAQEELTKRDETIAELSKRNDSQFAQIRAHDATIETLRSEAAQAVVTAKDMRDQLVGCRESRELLQKEIARLERSMKARDETLDTARERIVDLERSNGVLAGECDQLRSANAGMTEGREEIRQYKMNEGAIIAAALACGWSGEQLKTLPAFIRMQGVHAEELGAKLTTVQAQLECAEQTIKLRNDEVDAKHDQVQELEADLEKLRTDANAEVAQLQSSLNRAKGRTPASDMLLELRDAELWAAQAHIRALEAKHGGARYDLGRKHEREALVHELMLLIRGLGERDHKPGNVPTDLEQAAEQAAGQAAPLRGYPATLARAKAYRIVEQEIRDLKCDVELTYGVGLWGLESVSYGERPLRVRDERLMHAVSTFALQVKRAAAAP